MSYNPQEKTWWEYKKEIDKHGKITAGIRAYLAGKIIGGLCSNPSIFQANDQSGWDLVNCTERQLSDYAVRIADEMILALNNGKMEP